MEKVVRDGLVAILYSPGYGSGWFTSHGIQELIFHPLLIEFVENNKHSEITEDFIQLLGFKDVYCGGAIDLRIKWLPKGTVFKINEYDGAESVSTLENMRLITA